MIEDRGGHTGPPKMWCRWGGHPDQIHPVAFFQVNGRILSSSGVRGCPGPCQEEETLFEGLRTWGHGSPPVAALSSAMLSGAAGGVGRHVHQLILPGQPHAEAHLAKCRRGAELLCAPWSAGPRPPSAPAQSLPQGVLA